jgi:hypothetical protein
MISSSSAGASAAIAPSGYAIAAAAAHFKSDLRERFTLWHIPRGAFIRFIPFGASESTEFAAQNSLSPPAVCIPETESEREDSP